MACTAASAPAFWPAQSLRVPAACWISPLKLVTEIWLAKLEKQRS